MKTLLFRVHQHDPIGGEIQALTDEPWTHVAVLVDEVNNIICEAYFPHVRYRILENTELAGIDVFETSQTYPDFTALTAEQNDGVLKYCAEAVKAHTGYSIKGLFDFIPGIEDLIGKVRDDGVTSNVFCSQFNVDAHARGAKLFILGKAQSSKIAPGYLTWSVLMFPSPQLEPLTKDELEAAQTALKALQNSAS